MKTTGIEIEQNTWLNIQTLVKTKLGAEFIFEKDATYAIQAKNNYACIAISDTEPTNDNYLILKQLESLSWTCDGKNTIWVKKLWDNEKLTIVIS